MLKKYKFWVFNLVFWSVMGLIFLIGYFRPIPDADTIHRGSQAGTSQNQLNGCIWCP